MLDVFIKGIGVDLAIPTLAFSRGDTWYRWLNDPIVTRYLADQGLFPNTPDRQEAYFLNLDETRLVLVAQTKQGVPRGIVSLSHVNLRRRQADFALIFDHRVEPRSLPVAALEASALMLEHGVDKLGLQRIQGSQHCELARWQQRRELLGFRLEGIQRLGFTKGSESADLLIAATSADDINAIRERRGGKLFDCPDKMRDRIAALPTESMNKELHRFFSGIGEDYYQRVFQL